MLEEAVTPSFRQVRVDTQVGTIEERYGVELNSRSDALIGNLLEDRGFDSVTQLVEAYRGRARGHSRRRRIFLTFHAEDRDQVNGFRLMARNPRLNLDFSEASFRAPINSEKSATLRRVLRQRIRLASVVVCLIGNGTAWRDWVDWELGVGLELRKGLCGVRLRESRGRTPPLLSDSNSPIARWDPTEIVAVIERAAATRS
jgi:hypothetical protein